MNVYQTDYAGYYIGVTTADPDPLTPGEWLIPGGCVTEKPPALADDEVARHDGQAWVVETVVVEDDDEPEPEPTDDELADIIGDDWFEDFDVSNDGFNIDTYGEKAKQNLVEYANSWFDDRGYNVNVLGVEHNDVDHDLKWYDGMGITKILNDA